MNPNSMASAHSHPGMMPGQPGPGPLLPGQGPSARYMMVQNPPTAGYRPQMTPMNMMSTMSRTHDRFIQMTNAIFRLSWTTIEYDRGGNAFSFQILC